MEVPNMRKDQIGKARTMKSLLIDAGMFACFIVAMVGVCYDSGKLSTVDQPKLSDYRAGR